MAIKLKNQYILESQITAYDLIKRKTDGLYDSIQINIYTTGGARHFVQCYYNTQNVKLFDTTDFNCWHTTEAEVNKIIKQLKNLK